MLIRNAIAGAASLVFIAGLAGCATNAPNTSNPGDQVSFVLLSPSALSLNSGEVVQLVANVKDGFDEPSSATVSYSSSNSALVTVSPSGLACAGAWNSGFTSCNGLSGGNPVSGQATVTATAKGTASNIVTVIVHAPVSSIVVDPVAGCTSATQTQQFTPHVCTTFGAHDSSGPCAPNAHEITSSVGPLTWQVVDPTVATIDGSGLVTAKQSGFTGVLASVSNVVSAPAGFRTCMPIEIRLHLQGDPAGSPTTSVNMTPNQSLTLETDLTDENGFTQNNVAVAVASDSPVVAGLSNLTLTANSFGGSGISSGCIPSICGSGFAQPFPIYSNLFSVTVAGTSPAPIVYATSSFAPPSGTSPKILPIDTSKTPPAVGTAVNLPGVPNSLVFAPDGSVAWIGTNAGLVHFDPSDNTATVVDSSITGKVLAVSPNGSRVIVSNAAKDPQGNVIEPFSPNQRVWVFASSNNTTQTFVKPGAVAAAFSGDSFRNYIVTNDGTGNIYVFSPSLSLQTINIGGTSSGVAPLPSGPYAYVANSAGLEVVATCNNVQQPTVNNPPTNSGTIQLAQAVLNADTIVALDSTGIDVETVTVKSILSTNPTLPFVLSPANCQPPVSYTNQFLDFGIGSFTGRQLLVASNGSRVAVLPAGNANLLSAVPGGTPSVSVIPLAAGATEPLSGGMTLDGNTVWAGVAGTNTVDKIDLLAGIDAVQVTTSFKKSDGTAAPADIVAVWPK